MEHTVQKNPKRTSPSKAEMSPVAVFKQSALSAALSLLFAVPLVLLGAMICYRLPDPNAYTAPVGIGLNLVVSLLGGIIAARRNHGAALLSGICSGTVLMLFFLGMGLFFSPSSYSPLISVLLRMIGLLVTMLGAWMGGKSVTAHKKTKKHGHRSRSH